MTNIKLISDKDALAFHIGETITKGQAYREALHLGAVSALAFAAKHGNVDHLNRLFKSLTKNDMNALTAYVRKFQTVLDADGNPVRDVLGKLQSSDLTFLMVENGEFKIIGGTMPNRVRFQKFAEDKLLPEADHWHAFSHVDVIRDAQTFTNRDILKGLKALLKKASANDPEKAIAVGIDPKVTAALSSAINVVESVTKQAEEAAASPSFNTPAPAKEDTKPAAAPRNRTRRNIGEALAGLQAQPAA